MAGHAQSVPRLPEPLDPGRSIQPLVHTPLPEEYIWTAGTVTAMRTDRSKYPWRSPELRTEWHQFRKFFELESVPKESTLYLAGPREAVVYLNGRPLAHFVSNVDAPIGFRVFHVDTTSALRRGRNILAVRVIRGRGVVSDATMATVQLAYGEVLALGILPARFGLTAPAIVKSDRTWRSVVGNSTKTDWVGSGFDDTSWPEVASLGGIEGNRDFMQWSADAGMYGWPGYMGMTAPLGTFELPAATVTHLFEGDGALRPVREPNGRTTTFDVEHSLKQREASDLEAPALLLDFGREISGRLLVHSSAKEDFVLSIAYGESELEAMATGLTPGQRGGNYLGTNLVEVGQGAEARGPKSGFRFVLVRFLRGSGEVHLSAEGIAYPVTYAGSFESSDEQLNRIWETGAYTAHLCMGDDLWDAPKRDRGRWAGDIDVEGKTISDVFGDSALLERTLTALVPAEGKQVNGIPGYSALWVTSMKNLDDHFGDIDFLKARKDDLLLVLHSMEAVVQEDGSIANNSRGWFFVDWAPGMYGATADAQLGTALQYINGFRSGAALLRSVGDRAEAQRMETLANRMEIRARTTLQNSPFLNWQIAALAEETNVLSEDEAWRRSLSKVKQEAVTDQQISPYFNATVLDAMARSGHATEALKWLTVYWGGMLSEGATSFWESYDLRWPKDTPHLSLQADGTSGFFVSMAHGWSSGPTAWLSEQVLGVRDAADGFRTVTIAPRLMGLNWARGSVPTPHGLIRVDDHREHDVEVIAVEVPSGVEHTTISLDADVADIRIDGKSGQPSSSRGSETNFELPDAGHHVISIRREKAQ